MRTMTSPTAVWPALPQVDVVAVVGMTFPVLVCAGLALAPLLYIYHADRARRVQRAMLKKERRRQGPR